MQTIHQPTPIIIFLEVALQKISGISVITHDPKEFLWPIRMEYDELILTENNQGHKR